MATSPIEALRGTSERKSTVARALLSGLPIGPLVAAHVLGLLEDDRLPPAEEKVARAHAGNDAAAQPRVERHEDQHQQVAHEQLDHVQQRLDHVEPGRGRKGEERLLRRLPDFVHTLAALLRDILCLRHGRLIWCCERNIL